jgi:hypothetical protein
VGNSLHTNLSTKADTSMPVTIYTPLSQVNACRLLRAQARAVAKEIENQEKEE